MENDLDTEGFRELVGDKEAKELGNNELIEALALIPDISEFLGSVEDRFDSAKLLGLIEEAVDLYRESLIPISERTKDLIANHAYYVELDNVVIFDKEGQPVDVEGEFRINSENLPYEEIKEFLLSSGWSQSSHKGYIYKYVTE